MKWRRVTNRWREMVAGWRQWATNVTWSDLPRILRQTLVSLLVLGVAYLIHLVPIGPLSRADAAIKSAVSADYDFLVPVNKARAWLAQRGGIGTVVSGGLNDLKATLRSDQGVAGPESLLDALESPLNGSLIASYGWFKTPTGTEQLHEGVDFEAVAETPVRSALTGVVLRVGPYKPGGSMVEIDHGSGVTTVYGSLSTVMVQPGDQVRTGQEIGVAGPGEGMGPHLHFEVRIEGKPVDPAAVLRGDAGRV